MGVLLDLDLMLAEFAVMVWVVVCGCGVRILGVVCLGLGLFDAVICCVVDLVFWASFVFCW